jgi:hypothetical protein
MHSKSIIIDIRPVAKRYYDQERELTFDETIRKYKKDIINIVTQEVKKPVLFDKDITSKTKIKLNVKDRELIITYEWDELSNINTWLNSMNKNLAIICNHLCSKSFNCFFKNVDF